MSADQSTMLRAKQPVDPDPRRWSIHRNQRGAPRWYQPLLEAWWIATRRWSLHRAWQDGLDLGRQQEYQRIVINGGDFHPRWLPIETAPKDGRFIWLSDGFFMRVGYWFVVTRDPSQEHWADMLRAEQGGPGDLQWKPRYWQPMPRSPKQCGIGCD